MRFTVHDSPDYYQLKVSVFNDDKKTELVGETWVSLEQIVTPGGGQNDVWHTLNCKGRYAGEIRIELTYYDTRPREEKTEKRRQSAPVDPSSGHSSGGVGGPRQPKPVRRPLPADPTDSSQPSSNPYTPPSIQQRYVECPDDYGFEPTPPPDRHYGHIQNGGSQGSPLAGHQTRKPLPHNSSMNTSPSSHQHTPSQHDNYPTPNPEDFSQENAYVDSHISETGYLHGEPAGYQPEYPNDWQSRPLRRPLSHSQGMIHSHSSPAIIDARPSQSASYQQQHPASSSPKSYSYDKSPPHQQPPENTYENQQNGHMDPEGDEGAPPPPVHRNSGSRPPPQPQTHRLPDLYSPIPATAPLNIRNGRGSSTESPLSQVHSNSSYEAYPLSTSPSDRQSYSQPTPSVSSHTSYSQPRIRRSQSPIKDYGHSMPPTLVPGYEPSIAEDESERIMHEKRMIARFHNGPPQPQLQQAEVPADSPNIQYQHAQASIDLPQYRYQQVRAPDSPPQSHYQQAPAPMLQSRQQARPRDIENVHGRRAHRASAPVMQPQTASPDPRTLVRKSVSPHPDSASAERRHSEVPFSPDSFDAFNPSINAAGSVNEPGARYDTPEQAREATHQHERRERLGDGPIIGNDGRIIDPSDHLPTDTWAPEPEQKAPKKGPQVTMRFRHSPQGAQPMPAARRPAVEHSVSNPVLPHGPNSATPNGPSPARARLLKKPGAAIGQSASSPIVPTVNTAPRSSPLRSSEPNYPFQERENHGGYGSSLTYGRPSQGNIPPPIPGKVPIGGGQEDWDASALSEEMRRIDIGVGGGQGRSRRRG